MLQTESMTQNILLTHQLNTQQIRKKIQQYSFCLTDKIGKGYTSTVYKGRNDITNQIVAIKVIQLKSINDQIKKNLLQTQLECFKKINHVNLLKYIDSYETINNCYIITEYCEGGDLEKQLRNKGKITEAQFANFFKQFIAGYESFFKAGFIHRDIKPANIFIKGQQIKIADFGMVKKLTQNPRDSYNVGTPVYMPPQSLISNIYTQKSDVWSIGVMCYQLTHGTFPWRGQDQRQLKFNIQNVKVTFDNNIINSDLANLINLCLQKNPNNRISVSQILAHPWVKKLGGGIKQINRIDYTTNAKSNNIKQTPTIQVLGQKNMNVISPLRSYTAPKLLSLNNIPSTNLLQLQAVPSIQLIQTNQNINIANRPLKTQRPTLDSANAPQPYKRKPSFVQQNRPKIPYTRSPSFNTKKTPLDFLISILNYLRYLHKVYKVIVDIKSKILSQSVRKKLIDVILKQLIKCLGYQEKVIKAKQNIYQLIGFQEFVASRKWGTYVNVVQQYSEKYRKIYENHNSQDSQVNSTPSRRLSFPLKSLLRQIHQKLAPFLTTTQNLSQNKMISLRYSVVIPPPQCFQLIELIDYLATLYNMEEAIFCYGWIIFVQKSQINDIVQGKCIVNSDNWSQIWEKLQKKIKIIEDNQI